MADDASDSSAVAGDGAALLKAAVEEVTASINGETQSDEKKEDIHTDDAVNPAPASSTDEVDAPPISITPPVDAEEPMDTSEMVGQTQTSEDPMETEEPMHTDALGLTEPPPAPPVETEATEPEASYDEVDGPSEASIKSPQKADGTNDATSIGNESGKPSHSSNDREHPAEEKGDGADLNKQEPASESSRDAEVVEKDGDAEAGSPPAGSLDKPSSEPGVDEKSEIMESGSASQASETAPATPVDSATVKKEEADDDKDGVKASTKEPQAAAEEQKEGKDEEKPSVGGDRNLKGADESVVKKSESPDVEIVSKKSESGKPEKEKKSSKQHACIVCQKVGKCKYNIVRNGDVKHLCDDSCFTIFRAHPTSYLRTKAQQESGDKEKAKETSQDAGPKKCANCSISIESDKTPILMTIAGETHTFCQKTCIDQFRKGVKECAFCAKNITKNPDAFMAPLNDGAEFKDFCSQDCLKKMRDKEKGKEDDDDDIEIVGTSRMTVTKPKPPTPAPVPATAPTPSPSTGPTRRTRASSGLFSCSVCHKVAQVKHEVNYEERTHKICSDTCFSAFRYANKLALNTCEHCGNYCHNEGDTPQKIQFEGKLRKFCSMGCVNGFRKSKTVIVACTWCGAKKSNFDMVERMDGSNKMQLFCTLNCLSLYRVNLQATSNQNIPCDQCKKSAPAQYHLTMSDASVRNFCCYTCVMSFQAQFTSPGKANQAATRNQAPPPARTQTTPPQAQQQQQQQVRQNAGRQPSRAQQSPAHVARQTQQNANSLPMISNVMSLAPNQTPQAATRTRSRQNSASTPTQTGPAPQPQPVAQPVPSGQQQVIIQPPPPKLLKNKSLLCKPFTQTKATSCRPHTLSVKTQTDEVAPKQVLIPVPVPIFVPVPMMMYQAPAPYPLPIPIPIPVPSFIPTTKKSAEKILKHIKEILEKTPADPFEAELLMMAEAVANADKPGQSDSDTEEEDNTGDLEPSINNKVVTQATFTETPDSVPRNEMGEDMLEMALRIAQDMDEPALDLEDSIQPNPIDPAAVPVPAGTLVSAAMDPSIGFNTINRDEMLSPQDREMRSGRGKGRGRGRGRGRSKRMRLEEPQEEPLSLVASTPVVNQRNSPALDANAVLKFTYGVNAWRHWVIAKNAQLERASVNRKMKLFKTDILACTADELNYSLCLFVKEVRKPNGEEYVPDSIYYLTLGIQQYLYENGRIDNIFADIYYEKFTECLNEILSKYEVRLNAHGLIVCRIEEEHLWEAKQLGAHSPHVLLNTLIYFNTKYFQLRSVDEHLCLSFSHIMKHWKKSNVPGSKTPGRSVYLRYYAPGAQTLDAGTKRKREDLPVYEQCENTENPLRCPVKLYEFYLSKCPESIRNRNDVFYLVPERSCVPDSPVWYSTANLGSDAMSKMLNRVQVVREIQEAVIHQRPIYMQ